MKAIVYTKYGSPDVLKTTLLGDDDVNGIPKGFSKR